MFAVRLTSLGSKFVSFGLCSQVQRAALTGRGNGGLLARQVSRVFCNLEFNFTPSKLVYNSFFCLGFGLHL